MGVCVCVCLPKGDWEGKRETSLNTYQINQSISRIPLVQNTSASGFNGGASWDNFLIESFICTKTFIKASLNEVRFVLFI